MPVRLVSLDLLEVGLPPLTLRRTSLQHIFILSRPSFNKYCPVFICVPMLLLTDCPWRRGSHAVEEEWTSVTSRQKATNNAVGWEE